MRIRCTLVLLTLALSSCETNIHAGYGDSDERVLNGDWATDCQSLHGSDPYDPHAARSYLDAFNFRDGYYYGAYERYASDDCSGQPLDVYLAEGYVDLGGTEYSADGVPAERLDFEGEFTCYTLIDFDDQQDRFVIGDFQDAGYYDCSSPERRHRYLDFEAIYYRR